VFKVESGIPLPPPPRSGGANCKYPWMEMNVGDSFFVATDGSQRAKQRVAMAASQRRKHGQRFAMRSVEGGVRVWRVE
jgi:hypothetical protein